MSQQRNKISLAPAYYTNHDASCNEHVEAHAAPTNFAPNDLAFLQFRSSLSYEMHQFKQALDYFSSEH
jgi:hypothetical protein